MEGLPLRSLLIATCKPQHEDRGELMTPAVQTRTDAGWEVAGILLRGIAVEREGLV